MNWNGIKSKLQQGAELVKQKSVDTVEYLKSDEFKGKVSSAVQKTKEGVGCVVEGVRQNETAQNIAHKTKEVFNDIKQSAVVQKIEEKSKDLKDSILGKDEKEEK